MEYYPPSQLKELDEIGAPFIDKAIRFHKFVSDDNKALLRAKSIAELAPVASDVIGRLKGPFATGIGPMRTGTDRTFTQNLRIFDWVYDWFRGPKSGYGHPVFYQLIFETDIHRIRREKHEGDDAGFIASLFKDFYEPIMTHKDLAVVLLMPDWQKSKGAMIEYGMLKKRSVPVRFVDVSKENIPGLSDLLKPEMSV